MNEPKTWDELTQSEKIEDLRRDVVRIFNALRQISADLELINRRVSEVADSLGSLRTREGGPNRP
jgi:hypothetical protein